MEIIHDESKNANFKTQNEYQINEYLSLRLENNQTIIYIAGRVFRKCKYLLLNISKMPNKRIEETNSIDELAEHLNHDMEGTISSNFEITPKEEFWGHCSNLQAWYERGYDSRLLHSNLAFPLLKQLTIEGDLQAQKVFKEEIVKRIESGNPNVIEFLIKQGYLIFLHKEELLYLKEIIDKYKTSKYKVVHCGIHNSGKSAIINLVLNKDIEQVKDLSPTIMVTRKTIKMHTIEFFLWDF